MKKCDYCQQGKPLVIGKTDDYGVSINNIGHVGYNLVAYGYDVHGMNTNGLVTKINYCPICGRNLNQVESKDTLDKIRADIEEYKSRQLFAIGVEDLEKGKQVALEYVLGLFDEYKAESEEMNDKEIN